MFCIDHSKLNKKTFENSYLLFKIFETIDLIEQISKFLTILYLAMGYYLDFG